MAKTWQVLPDPLTPDIGSINTFVSAPDTGRSFDTGFKGYGITRPLRRGQNGDFVAATGIEAVKAEVGLVLGTICASEETLGELPWRTEFGSLLTILRLRNNDDVLVAQARSYVVDAIKRWVPAVCVTDSQVYRPKPTVLAIMVTYDIIDPSTSGVLVSGIQIALQLGKVAA